MKKIFVSLTALIFIYSLVFSSLPLDVLATEQDEINSVDLEQQNVEKPTVTSTNNEQETNEVHTDVKKESTDEEGKKESIDDEIKKEETQIYSYASIKNKTAKLYKKDLKTVVVTLNQSDAIFNVTYDKNVPGYYIIKWQNENLYVKVEDLNFTNDGVKAKEKSKILTYTALKNTIIYSSTGKEQIGKFESDQDVAVVGDTTKYFEVQIGGVSGYIEKPSKFVAKVKSGNLLSTSGKTVGKIYTSDQLYTVTPTSNSKRYEIIIGSNKYLIDSSLLTLKGQTNKAQTSSRKEIITIKANSTIYADAKLKQAIVKLSSATKTNILSISGSNYLVQVGNKVGYVPISSANEKFAAKIKANAKIYKNTSKSSTVAINKNSSILYTVSRTSNNNLFAIAIGSNTYYVNYSDLTFTTSNPKTATTSRKDKIKLKSGFVLYQTASTKTPLFTNGLKNEQFVVAGIEGQYYKVYVGNVLTYVPTKYVVISSKNREVSVSSTPLYKYTNKKYVAIGTVTNGFTFKPTSSNATYYFYKKGNQTFAVKKSATIATNKGVSLKAKATAKYPVTLYTERSAAVYNASGVKIGTLKKGQTIALKGISSKKAIVDFMGQQAQVKFTDLYHKNIVNGKSTISYSKMAYYLKVISLMYPEFTKLEVIGKSVEGRNLYALRVGNGKKEILVDAALHAREYMTTNLSLEMIDTYSNAYYKNGKVSSYNIRSTLNKTSLWFLPMMNPDGVMLVQQGITAIKNKTNINIVKKFARNGSYKHWKANARGVDLNVNFDVVGWSRINTKLNYFNFKGSGPNSEPETKAFINFANKHHFKTNLSYHTSGGYIYWTDMILDKNVSRDYNLAKQVAKITGYRMEAKPSFNMYKYFSSRPEAFSTSWMIKNKQIPALTIEVGPYAGEKPVPLGYFTSIWNKNKTVPLYAAKEASKR